MESVEIDRSFRPGGKDVANPYSIQRDTAWGSGRRIAGVRESDLFQRILLVRTYGDFVFNHRDISRTLREHDGTNNTSAVLSASMKPNGTAEGCLLVNARSVFTSQGCLEI